MSFRTTLLILLTLLMFAGPGFPAGAQPVADPVPPMKPTPLMPIAAQINQQIQSIINGTTANTPAAATTTAANNNNAAAATTSGASSEEINIEPGETFGTKALTLVLSIADVLVEQAAAFAENFADLPQADDWLNRQINEPHIQDRWHAAGQDLLFTVGISFIGAFVLELLLASARRNFRKRKPSDILRRIAVALGMLAVELLPVIFFVGASLVLLNQSETQKLPRFVVLNVIYAITLNRLVMLAGQLLFAPRAENLRFVPLTTPQATYFFRWLGLFSFVAVYGYFLVDLARSIHVPAPAVNAFGSLLGLILVIMTICVISQKRSAVAVLLRGNLSAARRDLTPGQSLRLWFARSWHILAISYLVIGYLVTALGVEGGFAILMRGTVLTFLVLMLMGLALYAVGRLGTKGLQEDTVVQFHHQVLRFFLTGAVWIVAFAMVAAAWGANIPAFLGTSFGQRVSYSLLWIGVTVILLALLYGYVSTAIERHLNQQDKDGRPVQASARMRTLLPMVRNATFITFTIIAALVIMDEAGVNIGPLLAGAGVIGVAVGFGSQTLVKDFLTGLFIVIENTIAIGDVVKIGTHAGVVEALTVRTLRLRDSDGAVHILSFSEVTQIVNMTKDFAYALITVGVAYDSDLRRVMEVIKEVGEELRADAKFRASILDPTEVLGIDSYADSAIMIQARLRTRPGRQWDVKRALLLRLKERFDAEKIVIPYPTSMQITRSLMPPVAPPETQEKK